MTDRHSKFETESEELIFQPFGETSKGSSASYDFVTTETQSLKSLLDPVALSVDNLQKSITCFADALTWASAVLSQSLTASKLVVSLKMTNWSLSFDTAETSHILSVDDQCLVIGTDGYSLKDLNTIPHARCIFMINLINGLRDIWHEEKHAGFFDILRPEEFLLWERLRRADIDTINVMISWELRMEAYPELWRFMLTSNLSDMLQNFQEAAEKSPFMDIETLIAERCFKSWFNSPERIILCDHETLDYMDAEILDENRRPELGSGHITAMMISKALTLPNGSRYIEPIARDLLKSVEFNALPDDIVHAHLVQIIEDAEAVTRSDVTFRDKDLALKIFPNSWI